MDFDIPILQLSSLRILKLKEKVKYALKCMLTFICLFLADLYWGQTIGRQIFVIFTCL